MNYETEYISKKGTWGGGNCNRSRNGYCRCECRNKLLWRPSWGFQYPAIFPTFGASPVRGLRTVHQSEVQASRPSVTGWELLRKLLNIPLSARQQTFHQPELTVDHPRETKEDQTERLRKLVPDGVADMSNFQAKENPDR